MLLNFNDGFRFAFGWIVARIAINFMRIMRHKRLSPIARALSFFASKTVRR